MQQHEFNAEAKQDDAPMTISALSRTKGIAELSVEQCTPDQLRAKMYMKHGNLTTAFRQFDNSGDSRLCFEEFKRGLPKAMGSPVSETKTLELWQALDVDMTGEIDMHEFAKGTCSSHKATMQGVAIFKDRAVDVTAGQRPDHLNHRSHAPLFGVEGTTQSRREPRRSSTMSSKLPTTACSRRTWRRSRASATRQAPPPWPPRRRGLRPRRRSPARAPRRLLLFFRVRAASAGHVDAKMAVAILSSTDLSPRGREALLWCLPDERFRRT